MNSCSGSVRSFHNEDGSTPLNEKLDDYDFDTRSENGSSCSEAWSYQNQKPSSRDYIAIPLLILRSINNLGRLLYILLPTFLQNSHKNDQSGKQEKLHPTAYLDGMRGLAAFAVFLCHLSYGTFDITHTWGAGPPMVAIFFVISGYALSYKPLKQMRSRDFEGLMTTLTSSAFRRPLRLFLPCFASTFIVLCLTRLGLYELTEDFANDLRMVHEDHYWTAPDVLTQLCDWIQKMVDFVNVFDWSLYSGSIDLDRHLWTIPVEFRCSMALFLTHILVARMTTRLRIACLVFLIGWGTYWTRWEMVPFWAGIILAELDLVNLAKDERSLSEKDVGGDPSVSHRSFWRTWFASTTLVIGLFLASYPDADGHVSPGYVQLTNMIPNRYSEKHRFWPTIGAVMIVYSVNNLNYIKRIFTTKALSYLGQISFPLYVCHGFVIHTFTYFALDWIWEVTDAYADQRRLEKGFAMVALCTIAVTVWISDVFLRVVDMRCVRFARWLESKTFKP
ncbi:hypothetical protein LTR70_001489 [Exophiala xenobiotica]|uniref:Acyltransferase 3 domain-containing protein n=1 Tax=Lithohypha guttulata TaxID=1690604 RepID=A0ABR0KGX2_9EURO|nr:hypothetical protein LTR24_002779 [Lithohypha guttulata]KAK5327866.1 hypothetical protein LTR70_001489 [Exophiala xenobiotica]